MAFTTVCLIPEDGQLSHNAHFIEITVLITALKIHHFVSIVEPCVGTPHSGDQRCVEHLGSSSDVVVVAVFLSLNSKL